ncbi:hypothetical protein Tco_0529333 [Tanacetum coccineum]
MPKVGRAVYHSHPLNNVVSNIVCNLDVEVVVKIEVQDVASTTVVESDQELEFPSSDELDSYSSSSDDSDESDSTSSSSLEKIISNKGPSKELLKWYEDEKDEEHDNKDEEEDKKDKVEEDELWTPKSKGTSSKCLSTLKSKGKALSAPKKQGKSLIKSSLLIKELHH